jgi:CPA1 family monovalent cation:H+ antiporter
LSFVFIGVGGIVVGLVVGLIVTEAWRRTNDPTLEIMVSLLAPFAAYLPAERSTSAACSRPWSPV